MQETSIAHGAIEHLIYKRILTQFFGFLSPSFLNLSFLLYNQSLPLLYSIGLCFDTSAAFIATFQVVNMPMAILSKVKDFHNTNPDISLFWQKQYEGG